MAKINARGDREVARWRKLNGGYVVLTAKGRVLRQLIKGDDYRLYSAFKQTPDIEARIREVERCFPDAKRIT